jgi:apolipoprotein N-acyltransferase
VSGLLLALSFPPLHPLVLPFFGLVPFSIWILRLPADARGGRAAGRGGALLGFVYFGLVLHWIFFALAWFTKFAIVGYLVVLGLAAAMTAVFARLLHHGVRVVGAPLWIALPVTWTALEWSGAHLPGTLAFPWLGLGTSLTAYPELVGVAELVGARGITFWIALVNALLGGLVLGLGSRSARLPWALVGSIVVAVVGPMAWGVWRSDTLETRPAGRVAVVQLDVPGPGRLDAAARRDSTFVALDRLVAGIAPGSVDLVVLPEGVLDVFARSPRGEPDLSHLQRYSREVGAPILFGGLGAAEGTFARPTPSDGDTAVSVVPDGAVTPYNSAFLMEPQGLTGFQYDKRFLVPMVERVPLWPGRGPDEGHRGMYGVGEGWPLAEVGDARFGVLICYESSYPSAARALRSVGADVLVNITNDAWYTRTPFFEGTTATWQHPAHLVMRAIEHRVGVVRGANGGISFFVDPVGRIHRPMSLFEEGVRIEEVRTTDLATFYTRYGDLLGNASVIGALILLISAIAVGRRKGTPSLDRLRTLV